MRHPAVPITHRRRAGAVAISAFLTALLLLTALLAVSALPAAAQSTGRIGASDDPVTAALDISRATFPDAEARLVVLGRSDLFPDNLAGAAATGAEGPLLLADPAPMPLAGDVLSEIQRVLGDRSDAGSCAEREADVLVLGGTAAIEESVLDELAAVGYCPLRLAGTNRVETAVAVAAYRLSLFLEPDSPSRGTLFIATSDNPADSASASAYAASIGASIVVTEGDSLNPAVADLLTPGDTAWEQVYLLGGTAALSEGVETAVVNTLDERTTTTRIAGATRDDTAFVVATDLFPRPVSPTAAIVEGFAPDFWTVAIPGAAAAARYAAPLLYVQTDFVPGTTDVYLRQFPVANLLTVGSEARISETTRFEAESSLGSGS